MWLLVIIFIQVNNDKEQMGQKKTKNFWSKKNTGKLNARGNICAWREPVIAK